MKNVLIAFLSFITITACNASPRTSADSPPSHDRWNSLLKKYVNDDGFVNYKGIIKDKNSFEQYLKLLSDNAPSDKWSENEQKAYWINAYNAFTVKLIIDHYPLKSIKDIGSSIQIPFVNTPWQYKFFSIGGNKMKLDEIEHSILRKKFDDPRIHFAIVCASYSCPRLRNEAYTADKIEKQLDDQARHFLANKKKNIITPDKLQLSNYFKWYKGDFTKNGSLIDFLNKYVPVKISSNASISYMDYNWALNQQ